jgi:N-acetylmuramoyl-L-alanine amidase
VRTIRKGDRGQAVQDVLGRLTSLGFRIDPQELEQDRFGPSTDGAVRSFQQQRGLLADGMVGPHSWQELVEAGYALGARVLYLRFPYFRGDDVRSLQSRLNHLGFDPGREDGIFGEQTGTAVRDFQRNVGVTPDGIVGATTLEALARIRPALDGPGRTSVRETESLRSPGSLLGRIVAIEPAQGPGDPGATGPGGLTEAEATFAIAERLAAELEARGARPLLLRGPAEAPPHQERIARANRAGADAVVAIHMNSHSDPSAEGASGYYFGRMGSVSVAGRALAEVIQQEITARLGMKDGRTHPKSFPVLRETQMPAVHIEPCFITNPREERLLTEGKLPNDLALAIADALDRFFAGETGSQVDEI